MEWGTPVKWGKFLLFCVPQSVKTKETNPTRPGSPTPCKQALNVFFPSVNLGFSRYISFLCLVSFVSHLIVNRSCYWAAREGNAQSRNNFHLRRKKIK